MKILVINGPNLNMLGIREPIHYGTETYNNLIEKIKSYCYNKNIKVECYQSNHEGFIVDKIQDSYGVFDGIIINPGAYTHTSISILDAIRCVSIPTVEVHISNIKKRESFRQISYIRCACIKTISGIGTDGYLRAIDVIEEYLNDSKN